MNNMNGMNMNPMGGGMNMNSNMGGMNPNMAGAMNPNMGHHGGMMNPSSMHHMPGMANGGMPMNMGMGMGMPGSNGGNGGGNPSAMNPMGMPGMGGHMPSHHGQPHGHHMMGMNGMPQMQQMSHNMNMGMHMGQGGAPNMSNSYAMPPSNPSYPPPSTAPPSNGQSIANMEWRAQFTREHRTNLIAKMYNEMVRVSTDPPGIALWINVAWFELKLYKECQTQEDYINKILKRLQHLKTQAGDMNPMGHNMMPGHGMPGRDANGMYMQQPPYGQTPGLNINTSNGPSFPNTSGSNSGGPSSANTPKHTQPGANNNGPNTNNNNNGPNKGPGGKQPLNPQQLQQQQQQQQQGGPNQGNKPPHMMPPSQQNQQPNKMGSSNPSPQPNEQSFMAQMSGGPPANTNPVEYWRQHAQLKAKYLADVNTVHNAFRKYVEHMKDQNESEQKKKLTYLLGYVQLCASILSEDASSAPARHIDELEKVNKYVIKIVHPYLKKLKSEKDKRSSASNTPQNQMPPSHNGGGNMGNNPQAMSFEMMMRNSMSGPPAANGGGSNNLYQQMMAKNSSMMMDDYGMGMPSSNGNGNGYGNQYGGNPNMGGFNMASYGSTMGGNDGNDMMGTNSMDSNLLDFDNGLGMGMADGNSNGNGNGSNSSNDDGGDGDLMNMVEAL